MGLQGVSALGSAASGAFDFITGNIFGLLNFAKNAETEARLRLLARSRRDQLNSWFEGNTNAMNINPSPETWEVRRQIVRDLVPGRAGDWIGQTMFGEQDDTYSTFRRRYEESRRMGG